jgi:hypothetical protein
MKTGSWVVVGALALALGACGKPTEGPKGDAGVHPDPPERKASRARPARRDLPVRLVQEPPARPRAAAPMWCARHATLPAAWQNAKQTKS